MISVNVIELKKSAFALSVIWIKRIYLILFIVFVLYGLVFNPTIDHNIFRINILFFVLLLIISIIYKEYEEVGILEINNDCLFFTYLNKKLAMGEIKDINIFIDGYKGRTKVKGAVVSISNGSNNYITIHLKSNETKKIYFLLKNKKEYNKLRIEADRFFNKNLH